MASLKRGRLLNIIYRASVNLNTPGLCIFLDNTHCNFSTIFIFSLNCSKTKILRIIYQMGASFSINVRYMWCRVGFVMLIIYLYFQLIEYQEKVLLSGFQNIPIF